MLEPIKSHRFTRGCAGDYLELAGDGQMLEIRRQIGNLHREPRARQPLLKESRLTRCRTGSEAVQVENAIHYLGELLLNHRRRLGIFGELDLGIGGEKLEGGVTIEVLGHQLAGPQCGDAPPTRASDTP